VKHSITQRVIASSLAFVTAYSPLFASLNGTLAYAQATQNTSYSYQYDEMGNVTKVIDPLNRVSSQSFDPLGRLKQQVQPVPNAGVATPTIDYTYDLLDQPATVTDPRKLVTSYGNNGLGDAVSLTSPDTGKTTRTFDPVLRTVKVTDARGKSTIYKYDALGRLKSETYSTGTATVFEYDGGTTGAPNAVGHLTKITDESGSTVYSYTEFGNVASKMQTVTASSRSLAHTVSYTYGSGGSATGKLTSMTYPSGNQVNYRYDAAGRVNMITVNPVNANGTGTNTALEYALLTNIEYAAHGPVKGWQWGNSTSASPNGYSRTFDLDGRIVSYNLGNPASTGSMRTLTWDAASRIKGYTHTSSGTGTNAAVLDQSFEYDDLDRLTSFTGNGTTQAYTYDANGNRTTATFGGTTYNNTISATSNRLDATTGPVPAKTNTHDLAGNLTDDGKVIYAYSARGRMSSATIGTTKTSYLYNGLGQRVRQVTGTLTNPSGLLVYDEAGHIIGEYNSATGKASKEFVYLGDMPVGVLEQVITGVAPNQVVATNLYYVYVDHLATPRVITRSPDGKMVWRWDSGDPFGLLPPNENPTGAGVFTFNLRMPGQYFDKSTNLFYNYFRNYDPQTGRYVQSDPIGLNGGVNTYAYVGSSPLRFTDPRGLCLEDLCIGEAIIAARTCAMIPACAAGVATITGGVIFSQSNKQARKESHDAYKAFQRQGYQRDPNDPCQELRNKIDFHKQMVAYRKAHDKAFPNPGWPNGERHADVNDYDSKNIERWEKELEDCEKSCKR
jgi:RHS repeat-associated protein